MSCSSHQPASPASQPRIYLSPPDVGDAERSALLRAFDSRWIAPLGPEVDAFEQELAEYVGVGHAAALSSGTAALHLALLVLGIQAGDDVLIPTLTFAASANAAVHAGARPCFVDCSPDTWTLDPDLLEAELACRAREGRLPAAIMTVDLYGQCADYERIVASAQQYDIPVLQDAAEALGARHGCAAAGAQGRLAAFSFNGNKIITTSGGGMLVGDDAVAIQRVRHLASQARQPAVHYEHNEVGFNYRLSNLLAALGRAQLQGLPQKVAFRRKIFQAYRAAFRDLPIQMMPEAPYGECTRWLTCVLLETQAERDRIVEHLASQNIEARPVWKPLHLQPVFEKSPCCGGRVATDLFQRGLCLPSGSNLTAEDQSRVIAHVRRALGEKP